MAIVHRFITAGVLAIWATVLCFFYVSGRVGSYLHPMFQPYVLASGIVLGIFAILVLLSPEESALTGGGCQPDRPRSPLASVVMALVLVLPLLITLRFSRDEFSAVTVLNRGFAESAADLPMSAAYTEPALPGEDIDESASAPLSAEDMPPPEMVDLLYAAQIPEMRKDIENTNVELVGQFMPAEDADPDGRRFRLVRMMVMCCAADAQPISVMVDPKDSPAFDEMTWVKVSGKATFPMIDGQRRPILDAATVEQTEPPQDKFLY